MTRLYAVAPPAYTPTAETLTSNYAFVPYSAFPGAPPSGSVYMWMAPPPYPGVTDQYVASPFDSSSPDAPPPEPVANLGLHTSSSPANNANQNSASDATIVYGYFDPSAPNVVYTLEPTPNGVPYADAM